MNFKIKLLNNTYKCISILNKYISNNNTINTCLSTTESIRKLSKEEQRQNHGYGERFDGCQMGGVCGEWVRG